MKIKNNYINILSVRKPAMWVVFLGMLYLSGVAYSQKTFQDKISFVFNYSKKGKKIDYILVSDLNKQSLKKLDNLIQLHKQDILEGRGHLSLVGCVHSTKLSNAENVNTASIKASVVRNYIRAKYALPIRYTTFSFDTDHKFSPNIELEYIPMQIKQNANINIYYTLRDIPEEIERVYLNYNPIPLVSKRCARVTKKEKAVMKEISSTDNTATAPNAASWNKPKKSSYDARKVERASDEISAADLWSMDALYGVITFSNGMAENQTSKQNVKIVISPTDALATDAIDGYNISSYESYEKQSSKHKNKNNKNREYNIKYSKLEAPLLFIPIIGVKTNLIYWLGISPELKYRLSTPNLELEGYFNKRWSVNIDGCYTFDKKINPSVDTWSISCVSLEPRVWLKNDNHYHGLYFGVYGMYGDFDSKKATATDGKTGKIYETGLSLGYYIPVVARLGFEIGARVGYRTLNYDTYLIKNGHYYYKENLTEGGLKLTTIRFLLTYRLGRNATNQKQ